MSVLVSNGVGVVMMISATAVLAYAAIFLVQLRKRGQLERLLVRAVIDPARRRRTLIGISIVNGMFVLMGAIFVLGAVHVIGDDLSDVLLAGAFSIGSATLLAQIRIGSRDQDLSIEHELELRDHHPDVWAAIPETASPMPPAEGGSYLAVPFELSRRYASRARETDPEIHDPLAA